MSKKSVSQATGQAGQPCVEIRFGEASARVYLQGAHLDSYMPDGKTELLWVSETAVYMPGRSIRGGIPVCWPWFGEYMGANREGQPQHGFARTSEFELIASEANEDATQIVLQMRSQPDFSQSQRESQEEWQTEWRNSADLRIEISLSDCLEIKLITTNIGQTDIEVGAALHSYFRVEDVSRIQIPQLQGLSYRDKLKEFESCKQVEAPVILSETDRIYLDPPQTVEMIDPLAGRKIEITSAGNTDLVVWNPWKDTAKTMNDFDDHGYKNMLCIEPAHALDNRQVIKPQKSLSLSKRIQVKSL